MKRVLLGLVPLAIAALGIACSEERYDCRDICQTAQSCISVNIDVSDCTDQCTSFAQSSDSAELQAEQCNDCLDARACFAAGDCRNLCSFVTLPID